MQLRHLYQGDLDLVVLPPPEVLGATCENPVASPGVHAVWREFLELRARRLPGPIPVLWLYGAAGTGKTWLLNSLDQLASPSNRASLLWDLASDERMRGELRAVSEHPPMCVRLSGARAVERHGVETVSLALLRALNAQQGYCEAAPELAAMERFLAERSLLEAFARGYQARTGHTWNGAREGAGVLREDLVKAVAAAQNIQRETAEKQFEQVAARTHEPAILVHQVLTQLAERQAAGQRLLVLVDDFDVMVGNDATLMREALTLLSRLACESHGRIAVAVAARHAPGSYWRDGAESMPSGMHEIALKPSDAFSVLQARWLKTNALGQVTLAMLSPEPSHPYSSAQLAWLERVLAGHADLSAPALLLGALKRHADRPAVELLGPAALFPELQSLLPSDTARQVREAMAALNPQQAEILAALALSPLAGQATLTEAELAALTQHRLGEVTPISAALSGLEQAGWVRKLEAGVALNPPEARQRQVQGETLSLGLRERQRMLAELLFDKVLDGWQQQPYRNGRTYDFNRFCDGYAHGSANHELTLLILTPLVPEHAEFDEFRAVLRSAEGGGQALLKLPAIADLSTQLASLARLRQQLNSENESARDALHATELELSQQLDRALRESEVFVAGRRLAATSNSAHQVVESALTTLIEAVHSQVGALAHTQSETLSMIRVVLGGRELPKSENGEALAQLDSYFAQHIAQPLRLSDLVQRYRRRPYGWPDLEIVLLVARLAGVRALAVRVDGHAALPPEAAEAFTNAALWNHVTIVRTPPGVSNDMLRAAELGSSLFGMQLTYDSAASLASALRTQLDGWRGELAEMVAMPAGFAGAHDAKEALAELKRLMILREGPEFLAGFIEQHELLEGVGADLAELRASRAQQGPAFARLRKTLIEIQPNLSALNRDPALSRAIAELRKLQSSNARFEMVAEIEALCEQVTEGNFSLLVEAREQALERTDELIAEITMQLDIVEANTDLRERSLASLHGLRDRIDLEHSHPTLVGLIQEALNERDAVFERINRHITSERPAVAEQHMLLTVVRPGKFGAGLVIEQEADLELYFDRLREALAPILRAGMRVRLE